MNDLIVYTGYVNGSNNQMFIACIATSSLKRVSEIMNISYSKVKKDWHKSTNKQEIEKALTMPHENIYEIL